MTLCPLFVLAFSKRETPEYKSISSGFFRVVTYFSKTYHHFVYFFHLVSFHRAPRPHWHFPDLVIKSDWLVRHELSLNRKSILDSWLSFCSSTYSSHTVVLFCRVTYLSSLLFLVSTKDLKRKSLTNLVISKWLLPSEPPSSNTPSL